MGNASSFSSGIQAKRVSFNDPCAEISVPQSAKPGLFSGEPASFFTGVVAGTEGSSLRRWSSGKGMASWNGGPQDIFLEPPLDGQVVSGTGVVEPVSRRWQKRSTCSQQVEPPVSWMEADRLVTEIESCVLERGSLDTRMLETDLLNTESDAGLLEDDPVHVVLENGAASLRRRHVGVTRRSRRAALRAGALSRPSGRRVRAERSEAGSDFASQFCSGDPPLVRLNRVNDIICESQSRVQPCLSQNSLTHNSHSTSARSLHAAHNSHARMSHARCVVNSEGDTEDGGRLSCVYGGTKSLSTCTRTGVRRPAVEKLASPQQASLKLHDEMWAGLPMNLGPRIFREVEIIPGCAVRVACPSCPDYYPEPPGPGIVIRNMLGWSQLEKTERSGVWVFRGALQGENLFSLLGAAGDWVTKGSYHTAWAVPCDSSCSCSYAYGHGPAIGPHTGQRCWPLLAGLWRAIAPLMKPWCAEGDVPTAANLNLYRGWKSCVGWHCDDEPLFGKCGDAKLIVSVSLGNFALFRWRRQSCSSNEDSSCRLDHGDILVMDGQCQDEFLHRTSPGREQDRINITFRWVKQHVASCPLFKAGVACCLPTCAQGSSVPVMGNVSDGVFLGFLVSS